MGKNEKTHCKSRRYYQPLDIKEVLDFYHCSEKICFSNYKFGFDNFTQRELFSPVPQSIGTFFSCPL
jgi:hypothetical protein